MVEARPTPTDCWPDMKRGARPVSPVSAAFLGIDAALVIVFAALGKNSHDESGGVGLVLKIAAPYLIALAVGWLVVRLWRSPLDLRLAAGAWLVTVALGTLLRRTVFDRGTAFSFVVVATIVLGAFLLGWRLLARRVRR